MQILIPASAKLTIDCCDHHVTVGGFVTDTNGNTANFAMNSIPAAPTAFVESGGNDIVCSWYAANGAVDWQRQLHVLDP